MNYLGVEKDTKLSDIDTFELAQFIAKQESSTTVTPATTEEGQELSVAEYNKAKGTDFTKEEIMNQPWAKGYTIVD